MRNIVYALLMCLFYATACTDQTDSEPLKFSDPAEHNMKFIPQNPGSNDQLKLVIYNDCTYNALFGITQNGNTIEIEKRFNSLMKLPCMMSNDTILIGKLPEGSYTINYKLSDIATPATPQIVLLYSFSLVVSK